METDQKHNVAKYNTYVSQEALKNELEALVLFSNTYYGSMRDSMIHRIRQLNSMIND